MKNCLSLKCKLFDKVVLEALRFKMTIIITSQWWHKTSEKWLPVILPGNHHHFLLVLPPTLFSCKMLYWITLQQAEFAWLISPQTNMWKNWQKTNELSFPLFPPALLSKYHHHVCLEITFFSRLSSILIEDPTPSRRLVKTRPGCQR